MRRKWYVVCAAASAVLMVSGCQQRAVTPAGSAETTVEGNTGAGETGEAGTSGDGAGETSGGTAGGTAGAGASASSGASTVVGANYISSQTEIAEIPIGSLGTITLPDYSSIPVTLNKVDTEPTAANVTDYINSMLASELKDVSGRGAQKGDVITVDFTGTVDGADFAGNTGTDIAIQLGTGQMLSDFEDALYDTKAGDKVTAEVNFPEDYTSAEVAGKKAVFEITVKKLQMPSELTQEYIKAHSSAGASTEEEFRAEIKQKLQIMNDNQVSLAAFSAAISQLSSNAVVQPSEAFSSYLYRYYKNDLKEYLESMNQTMEDYKTATGMDDQGVEDAIWSTVNQNYAQIMVLRQIAEDQGLNDPENRRKTLVEFSKEMYGSEITEDMLDQIYGNTVSVMGLQAVVYNYLKDHIQITYQESTQN